MSNRTTQSFLTVLLIFSFLLSLHNRIAAATEPDNKQDSLIKPLEQAVFQDQQTLQVQTPLNRLASMEQAFSISGYETERISVDFYKIDIHNVFRLFQEISALNIIVDENVKGSLTLALHDVPWRFALDIILNLMNLKKEEKFNTIVIYPAKKEFIWPTQPGEDFSFQPDIEVIEEQRAVAVEAANQPAKILRAREILRKAQLLDRQKNPEEAAKFYNEALELWPTNNKISNRLAMLYLVRFGMNTRALYYAQQSLKNQPKDRSAALYAAIASANMNRLSQAKKYFIQSINDTPPMKEALISYAAFCENNAMDKAALKLLARYEKHYGENLNTMIAKARILDNTGKRAEAQRQYQSILASGYQLPIDLRRYIEQRVTEKMRQTFSPQKK